MAVRERWSYDVFLSFRGADVRNNFLGHLDKSLVRAGINTFRDDDSLKRGENISSELLKAIENSKVHLVVLSKNYASSAWCLDELQHIMLCYENDSGHRVVPIFYKVEPSDVRRQKESFSEAFAKHKSRYPESKLLKWKEALSYVTKFVGFNCGVMSMEADLIMDVTQEILRILPSSYLHLPSYAVGIRSRVRLIHRLMCFGSDDVHIIGIWGMGGIGKTTLAKAAYNEFSNRFEGTSFLENFGEYSKKPEGKGLLQEKLLSDIFRMDDIVLNKMDRAVTQRFRNKKVLIVLDDVKDFQQVNSIATDLSWFGPGSRIIITCRDRRLLEQLEVQKIYPQKELGGGESLQLLCWHAFRTVEPPEAFLLLVEKLVEYCGGLPLAMEVLGTFLFKRSISFWKDTLETLKETPDDDIQAKLRISFDSLNSQEKDIFLDISCFFIGMDKDYVSCVLHGCKLYPERGLTVLKERCLITVRDNRLMMHDLIRDMGRQVIRETSLKNCERWSRLWDYKNVIDALKNSTGTNTIEGVSLKAKVTAVENLEVKAFSNLKKLRLLQLSHVSLNGSYEHFPTGLVWLCWFKFPLDSLPTGLPLEELVVMDIQYSSLKRLWDDQQPHFLKMLKYLDLSHSTQLTETPDFSYLPNLEKLFLINCTRLVLVHKSIGTLHKKLVLLNFKGCTKLADLPLELYTLESLETLILSGCLQLERLDDALGGLKSLTTLKADYTAVRQIPSSINQLKNLQELSFDGCKELSKCRDYNHSDQSPQAAPSIPLSLNGLSCLKTLRLGSCNLTDELVPEHLGSLSGLEELDLWGNNFSNLQADFAGLLSLQILKLDGCSKLHSIFSLPKNLRSFSAENCTMLERTPDLSKCLVLQSFHVTNCSNLFEMPGLDTLKTVGVIHMEMCNSIPDTYRESIMQGWAVGANGRIFIPGSSLPNWVSFKDKTHSISFTVPETLNLGLVGFTLGTSYVSQQNDVMSKYSPKITWKNQTTGFVWSRNSATDTIRMYHEKHIWQRHFSNEDICLKTGDQVEVSVDFGDQVTILETGLTLAYREANTSNIGYEEIAVERMIQTEEVDGELVTEEIAVEQLIRTEEVDDELVTEENQSRPPSMDLQSEETIVVLNAENEYMENEEMKTEGQAQSATQSTQQALIRKKRKANCLKDFTDVGREEDGKERARCNHCSIKLVIDKTYGTSTMNRHLLICPERPFPVVRPKYDHNIDREMTAEIIICHDLPFRYVEYEKVRARDRFLNPDCQHICRQTAATDVYKRFEIEKLKLIDILAKHQGRVCFTADLWSARSTVMGYICITAHYIDDDWKLNNKILAFCDFKPPHNGEEIAKKVYDCMKEWGLEKKVFSITLDNASANDSMQKILKHRLQSGNGLLCDGKFLHVRCCAHILNLIVQEGLELARGLLENIRESVKFVKASELRKDSFATCVESVGIKSGAGLSLDVSTRWNSTYEMLARALKFRKAFANLNLFERGYKSMPSEDEWDRGEKICDLLKPFNTLTTYFSGVKYPTANVYFIQVWKIERLLQKYAICDDDGVKTMAWNMQRKFAKYWDQYSIILAMGAALDPRLKLQILTSAYNKVDPNTSEEKVEIVKKNLFLLYDEYKVKSAKSSKSSTTPTPHELLTESPLEDDLNDDLFELENSLKYGSENSKSILEIYLNEPRLEMTTFADIEVLSFWKENQQRYGDLASMASDLLSIPITTVASESAFSVGGRVLNPY